MTTKHHSTVNSDSSGRSARWLKQYKLLLAACLGLVTVSSSHAQNLQWAPNGIGPSDGSGTWLAGNNWWNGSSIVSGTWTGTTPNGATLGDGTAGTYSVDLGGSSVSLANLAFTTSGYNVTDGNLNFYDPSAANPFNMVNVSSGVSATISASITNATGTAATFTVASGGTLTLTGGGYLNANTETTGAGTVDFNSGTYSAPNFVLWSQGNVTQEAATLNISRLLVGYGGNSTYTINNASAVVTGSGGGGNNLIGRSGSTGVMDLKQGTVNMTASGNAMRIAYDANSKGTLTVEGGTLNLGTAANDIYVNYNGTGAPGAGTLNVSGSSVVTTKGILLGGGAAAGTYVAGSSATVNISGGTTYVGSDGINVSANAGTLNSSINLSGGTIGAAAAWTSTANMVLGTTGGNITFQTADATSVGHNITLNGILSGPGGLIHTGSGILSLGGVNTYLGNTTVNGTGSAILSGTGHLAFSIGANGVNNQINGTEALTLIGTFDINLSAADTTAGDVWVLNADNANTTYGGTFDLTGFTQNGDIWTDGIYQYSELTGALDIASVPEPSTTSAALFGGISLFLASRRLIRKK